MIKNLKIKKVIPFGFTVMIIIFISIISCGTLYSLISSTPLVFPFNCFSIIRENNLDGGSFLEFFISSNLIILYIVSSLILAIINFLFNIYKRN